MKNIPSRIVIATRESALALWQARHIESCLLALYPGMQTQLLGMTTEGDRKLDTSLAKIGGKGLFIKELEQALADRRADIAVHSMKDVPMALPDGFAIAAITERGDPRDAFVSNAYRQLADLPPGSRVGTSSLRRESQLRARFPQLDVQPLRGNVQTRLRKLDEGRYAAIILAAAGLQRLGLEPRITRLMEADESIPAVGQGALGIECRSDREDLLQALAPLNHADTQCCVEAERALSRALAGSCNVPIGGFADIEGATLRLRGFVGSPDGSRLLVDEVQGNCVEVTGASLGTRLAEKLAARGANEILSALNA
ncbi:MAG: hydroxymethylbilane synthase [Burkholderiales bacterium]